MVEDKTRVITLYNKKDESDFIWALKFYRPRKVSFYLSDRKLYINFDISTNRVIARKLQLQKTEIEKIREFCTLAGIHEARVQKLIQEFEGIITETESNLPEKRREKSKCAWFRLLEKASEK
ncbi:MAG: hypothetical protein ACM3KR_09010 [Deltaproteobacteria bacterium]